MIQKAVVKKILDRKYAEIEVRHRVHDLRAAGGCGAPLERIQAVAINRVDVQRTL